MSLHFNRKTSGDTLELVEESLDINLLNNAVRLKFQNCILLPGGVHVSETPNHVIILILTNQTVHRLLLPHPSRMYRSVSWLSIISFNSQSYSDCHKFSNRAMSFGIEEYLDSLLALTKHTIIVTI